MSIFDRLSSDSSETSRQSRQPSSSMTGSRAITASAVRINLKDKREVEAVNLRRQSDTWQEEAWEYYNYIPEVAFSANLVANILSRVNLYVGYVKKTSSNPADIRNVEDLEQDYKDTAEDILYLLESGNGGTAGLLRDAALNFFIAGECYLVREPGTFSNGMQEKYQIRSISEVISLSTSRDYKVAIKKRRDAQPKDYINIPKDGYAARLWKNHPQWGDEADSSMRGLLELCDALLLLDRTISANARTRLPAGILFVPDGLSNSFQSDGDLDPEDSETADLSDDESQSFEEELQEALLASVGDDSNGGTIIPVILRGNAEYGDKIRHISLAQAIDPSHNTTHAAKLDRILAGLDIPKDVAAGLSGVKYSNAILIEEQLYKAHVEPLILMIVDCLTTAFLRPALLAQGMDPAQVSRTVVWYDPSAITAKPSKAEAATTGYGLGAISLEAWRRAHGFTDSDAPSDLERSQRFAMEKGLLNEATTEKLISTILPEGMADEIRQQALAQSAPEDAQALTQALDGTDFEPVTDPATMDSGEQAPPPSTLLEP